LLPIVMTILIAMTAVLMLLGSVESTIPTLSLSALAAPLDIVTPTVTSIDPTSAPNDMDTPIVITGGVVTGAAGARTLAEASGARVNVGVCR
jgi:hypothetical protein